MFFKGLIQFCPNAITFDQLPATYADDEIEVFALKKPVWSFKFGPVMGYFVIRNFITVFTAVVFFKFDNLFLSSILSM